LVKKVLGLTIAIMLLSGMMGIGTWAYFNDFEAVAGNAMTAGTLLLKTNNENGVSQTLFATNMRPGQPIGPEYIALKNDGSLDASSLDIEFSYVENDGPINPLNKTADQTAAVIEVTALTCRDINLLSDPGLNSNSNNYFDIQDLKNYDFSGLTGIVAGDTTVFAITIKPITVGIGQFQGDGISIMVTFILNQ
jgi:predicted ribosomally synthesized peptide with SipW-like signal peptide